MIEVRAFKGLGGSRPRLAQGQASFLFRRLLRPRAHGLGLDLRVERRRDRARTPASRRIRTPTWRSSPMSATGAITHEDSLGNKGRTEAGDVQVMSAGSGVRHAEYNREPETTRIFQIWIEPDREGGKPSWGAKPFPKGDRAGSFVVLASGFERRCRRAADPRRGACSRRHAQSWRDRRICPRQRPPRLPRAG